MTVVPNTQLEPPWLIVPRTETFFLLFLSSPLQFWVSFRTHGKIVKDFLNWFKVVSSLEPRIQLTWSDVVSVVQLLSCARLCDPMDCSMPGFPVLHCLLEFAQTHVRWVGDAINQLILCHPLIWAINKWWGYGLIHTHQLGKDLTFFLVGWKCSSRQMPLFWYKFGAKAIVWPSYSWTAQKLTSSLRAAR